MFVVTSSITIRVCVRAVSLRTHVRASRVFDNGGAWPLIFEY